MDRIILQLWVDSLSGRKAGHPNQPATQTILGTIIGDSIMKQIELSQGKVALVDNEDFKRLSKFNWYIHKGRNTLYARRNIKPRGRKLYMHRDIMKPLNKTLIDHINDNGLDNRRCNLRFCTPAQNIVNSYGRQNRTSKYKGVSWCKNIKKWEAFVTVNYKKIGLGYFASEQKAAIARNIAIIKYFGEFARLNNV